MKYDALDMKNLSLSKITQRCIGFILRRILARPSSGASKIEFLRLVPLLIRFGFALFRSILFYRRIGFVMRNTEIRALKKFKSNGLFTIESGCLIDCYGDIGVHVGTNFKLGRNSIISVPGSYFSKGAGVLIGNNVGLGEFCYIGGEAVVEIGDNTISGQYLSIHPENHLFVEGQLFTESGTTNIGIKVGANVWLGSKVTLLDGCSIGSGSIVAAGAVVRGEFPENCVIAGVPAKVVGTNDEKSS